MAATAGLVLARLRYRRAPCAVRMQGPSSSAPGCPLALAASRLAATCTRSLQSRVGRCRQRRWGVRLEGRTTTRAPRSNSPHARGSLSTGTGCACICVSTLAALSLPGSIRARAACARAVSTGSCVLQFSRCTAARACGAHDLLLTTTTARRGHSAMVYVRWSRTHWHGFKHIHA